MEVPFLTHFTGHQNTFHRAQQFCDVSRKTGAYDNFLVDLNTLPSFANFNTGYTLVIFLISIDPSL